MSTNKGDHRIMDPLKTSVNSLLEALKVQLSDRIVLVNEFDVADGNFILTHLMKQALDDEENGVCLVILHNTIGHYQNVGKLLEYDLLKKVADGLAVTIEPLKSILEEDSKLSFLVENKEQICKHLFLEIKNKLEQLLRRVSGQVYLIIDDLSHLLDMAVETKHVLNLINCCDNLNERVTTVIGTHVSSGPGGEILSNAVTYLADVIIDVTPLKTGRSSDVTGVITIKRPQAKSDKEKETVYHYKALHREIRTFRPGDSVKFLLR